MSVWNRFPWFSKQDAIYLMIWAGLITLFFSFSSSKLIPYIAAIFLPLSLFLGSIFRRYDEQKEDSITKNTITRDDLPVILQSLIFIILLVLAVTPYIDKVSSSTLWWPWIVAPVIMQILLIFLPGYVRRRTGGHWFLTVYIIAAIFLGSIVFPVSQFITPYKSAYPLVQAVKIYVPPDQELYQYGMSMYGVDFYGKIRTPIVDAIGEVRYGSEFLPSAEKEHYFLNSKEFFKLVRQGQITYCVTEGQERVEMLRKKIPNLTIMWDNEKYYLVRLQPLPLLKEGRKESPEVDSGAKGEAKGN